MFLAFLIVILVRSIGAENFQAGTKELLASHWQRKTRRIIDLRGQVKQFNPRIAISQRSVAFIPVLDHNFAHILIPIVIKEIIYSLMGHATALKLDIIVLLFLILIYFLQLLDSLLLLYNNSLKRVYPVLKELKPLLRILPRLRLHFVKLSHHICQKGCEVCIDLLKWLDRTYLGQQVQIVLAYLLIYAIFSLNRDRIRSITTIFATFIN